MENRMPDHRVDYGKRYILLNHFGYYCSYLHVDIRTPQADVLGFGDVEEELQVYENTGLFMPAACVLTPVVDDADPDLLVQIENLKHPMPQDPANITDDDLQHPFDRQLACGDSFVEQPDKDNITSLSWARTAEDIKPSERPYLVDRYYHYWQVYKLYLIQQHYPIPGKFTWLADLDAQAREQNNWPEATRRHRSAPIWPQENDPLIRVMENEKWLDALSVYMHVRGMERFRVRAQAHDVGGGVRLIDDATIEALGNRMTAHAETIAQQYGMDEGAFLACARDLLILRDQFEEDERMKLASIVTSDLRNLAEFAGTALKETREELAAALSRAPGTMGKRLSRAEFQEQFLHLDRSKEAYDAALNLLMHHLVHYDHHFKRLPTAQGTLTDLKELLAFAEEQSSPYLVYSALPDAQFSELQTAEQAQSEFYRRVRDLCVTTESLMRALVLSGMSRNRFVGYKTAQVPGGRGGARVKQIRAPSVYELYNLIVEVLMNSASSRHHNSKGWHNHFTEERKRIEQAHKKGGKLTVSEALACAQDALNDTHLTKRSYLQSMLVFYWARNMTMHHQYFRDTTARALEAQFYYGDLGKAIVRHIYYALFFSWLTARRKRWV